MKKSKAGSRATVALAATLGVGVAALLLRRASRLPDPVPPPPRPDLGSGDTPLRKAVGARAGAHPGLSGIHLLREAENAFAARLLLIREAGRTLDLQYYIWHGDRTGTLMLEAVLEAARRGVHVRMLLDDNGIAGLDTILSALDRHPNIEVRLFNPFRIRFPKAVGFLADFGRLNRRMHNKSMTVDGAVAIVGGRNIGDEYFGAGDGALFVDMDALAIGSVVAEVEADFERYWRCRASYAAARILSRSSDRHVARLGRRASIVTKDPSAAQYVRSLETCGLVRDLENGSLDLEWAETRLISDDPAKVEGDLPDDRLLVGRLFDALGRPDRELAMISGYFVPGPEGTEHLRALARSGVSVSILTNGYAATDVALVHAGYAPWRRKLLDAGISLFELTGGARDGLSDRERRRGTRLGVGSTLRGSGTGSTATLRSGASTVHAKTFAIDRERLFIGSFNLDPRSIRLNTELGFIIHSPDLATEIAEAFDTTIPRRAWRVLPTRGTGLKWSLRRPTGPLETRQEPGMRPLDHLMIAIAARMPIGWLL